MFRLGKIPKLIQYIFCGSLLGVGFVFPIFWPVVFFGFAWFVFLVAGEKNIKPVLFLGWLIFTVKALWVNSFFLSIKPSSWIDDSWLVGTLIMVCSWILVSLCIGLSGLFLAGTISFLNKYLNIIYLGFFVPVLLVVSEVLGSLIFSIISYGTGSTINANYSFGYVGYLLAQHQLLLTTASFGGVYFLTFIVAVIGYIFYYLYTKVSRRKTIIITATFLSILMLVTFSPEQATANKNISVTILNTKFFADMRNWSNLSEFVQQEVDQATLSALETKTDYLVLPEGLHLSKENIKYHLPNREKWPIIVDNGFVEIEPGEFVLRANLYKDLTLIAGLDKQYLVPVGEYTPLVFVLISKILNFGGYDDSFLNKKNMIARSYLSQKDLTDDLPAVIFCFDGVKPKAVKNVLPSYTKVPFVAYPISHAWFENSKILENQIDMMMKVHAVYNQTDIVSAGNMAEGALYTKFGKKIKPEVLVETKWWQIGVVNF